MIHNQSSALGILLKEWFDYHEDGYLTWKKCKARRIKSGTRAGYYRKDGYYVVNFLGKPHLGHRLIFAWHYGYLPELIDHEDRDNTNNKINNLKESNKSLNGLNRGEPINNTSGRKGVFWGNKWGKWTARYKEYKGKYLFLGYFDSFEDAVKARQEKEDFYA
jgi:hypothetical protein